MSIGVGTFIPCVSLTALLATLLSRRWETMQGIAWASAVLLWLCAALAAVHHVPGWDALARWYELLVTILAGLSIPVSLQYLHDRMVQGKSSANDARRYLLLYHGFLASLLAVGSLPNYFAIWAAVEATTLTTVFLVAFSETQPAVEAAWKYAMVAGIGGLVALAGTTAVLVGTGTPLNHWSLGPGTDAGVPLAMRSLVQFGLVLAVVGFGSKAGLVPFHTWLPDAHSQGPAPVSATLSALKLVAGIYALLRLVALSRSAVGVAWPHTLLILTGILSLAVAAFAIPGQRDIKRMFAYSSIEHMGVIALGAGFGGIGLLGALLHMWTHAFSKTTLFYGAGNVQEQYHATTTPEVSGILATMPMTGSALAAGSLAIVGFPPFGVFWSEWLVLLGGVVSGHLIWVAVATALLVAIVIGFALRLPPLLLGNRRGQETGRGLWPLGIALAGALVVGLAVPAAFHGIWIRAAQLAAGGGVR